MEKKPAYIPLYRKWRPQGFTDLVGQNHVSSTLRNALKSGKLSHTYLFCGPKGTGKTSCARIFAKALNCPDVKDGEPCNVCISCRRITEGLSLDVQEMDAASHTQVEKVREFIIDRVNFAPVEGKFKVYIIDEAHKLSAASFDALLKTLEEPPPHMFFVLATTHPQNLPPTILSRCQRHDFRKITFGATVDYLSKISESEGFNADEDALIQVARLADGSLRDSLVIMEQVASYGGGEITSDELSSLLGLTGEDVLFSMGEKILEHDTPGALAVLHKVIDEGKDPSNLGRDLMGHFRNLLLIKATGGGRELIRAGRETYERLAEQARLTDMGELMRHIRILGDMLDDLRDTGIASLPWEMALIKMTRRSADPGLESVHLRLKALEDRFPDTSNPSRGTGTMIPSAMSSVPEGRPAPVKEKVEKPLIHKEKTGTPPAFKEGHPIIEEQAPPDPGQKEESVEKQQDSMPPAVPLSDLWETLILDVKSQKPSLSVVLQECRILDMGGDCLVLGIDGSHEFNKNQVLKNQGLLEKTASSLLGRPFKVKIQILSPQETREHGEELDVIHQKMVDKSRDIFGGRIIS